MEAPGMRFPPVTPSRPARAPSLLLRALCATLLATIAAGIAPRTAGAAPPETLRGKRVIVTSTVTVHEAAMKAVEILDQAVTIYEENLPYRLPEGEKLVFHLYEDRADYANTLTKADAEGYAQTTAVTLPVRKETHLVIAPRAESQYLRLVGNLPEGTRFFLCHEGARQFLMRTAGDLLPFWPD